MIVYRDGAKTDIDISFRTAGAMMVRKTDIIIKLFTQKQLWKKLRKVLTNFVFTNFTQYVKCTRNITTSCVSRKKVYH